MNEGIAQIDQQEPQSNGPVTGPVTEPEMPPVIPSREYAKSVDRSIARRHQQESGKPSEEGDADTVKLEQLKKGNEFVDREGKLKNPGIMERVLARVFVITHPQFALKQVLNGGKRPLMAKSQAEASYFRYQDIIKASEYWSLRKKLYPEENAAANKVKPEPVAA